MPATTTIHAPIHNRPCPPNFLNCSPYQTNNRYDTDGSGILANHLDNYWVEDGTEISWPKVGDTTPRNGSDWIANVARTPSNSGTLTPIVCAQIGFPRAPSANQALVHSMLPSRLMKPYPPCGFLAKYKS